jgi:hypothetical protein
MYLYEIHQKEGGKCVTPFIISCTLIIYETNEAPALLFFLKAEIMAYQQYFENDINTFQSEKKGYLDMVYLSHLIILLADSNNLTIQFLYCFLPLENMDHTFDTKWEHGFVQQSFCVILAGGDVAMY